MLLETHVAMEGSTDRFCGYGFFVDTKGGKRIAEFSGALVGYLSKVVRIIDDNISIVILTNVEDGEQFSTICDGLPRTILQEGFIQPSFLYPQLSFKYDWKSKILDFLGSCFFKKVQKGHKQQLEKQLPILIGAWEKNCSIFFDTIFSSFERGFKNPKRIASCYLSYNASYGSNRFLVLGLRGYLDSETWHCPLNKEGHFCDLVFHELLHVWLEDNIDQSKSVLSRKYRHENSEVIEHIHLMAMQKMVYTHLKRDDLLAWIDHMYRHLAPKDYARAWEIVNDIEGHETVLDDIKKALK